MEDKGRWYYDIEANGLLDDSTVDYSASPWKLRDNFTVHCIVATNIDTLETVTFVQNECYLKFKAWVIENVNEVVSHNGINYDMLVCKVAFDMDYSVTPDTWCGKPVVIHDTLVLSKVLNPDRRGHSIEYFGKILGFPKIDWRAKSVELGLIAWNAPKGAEFHAFDPAMVDYCKQDVLVGIKTFQYLMQEWGDWNWQDAYDLEKAIAEIITRQAHRGFKFDSELALSNVKELDELMLERKNRVEPNLPAKPMGKTKAKEYIPGKEQFKKNGEPNANVIKWCEKHGGSIEHRENDGYYTTLYGKEYKLPIPQEPIISTEPAHIEDTTFIKEILVKMGWRPTQYKERDLTVDTKKQKISVDKFMLVVDRYVKQTLESPFCRDRCDKLGVSPAMLKAKLIKHKMEKPLKVYTNPTFTVGQEKEIDPELEKLAEKFPYVQDIIQFLTYRHRRNSILGGGFDPEEDDEDEFESGFIPNVRKDGRIPTPADTCGAATGRMLHRICANVPRVTSLYGANMRGLFGVDTDLCYQHAYDFASLEGRIEAHFCHKYDAEGKPYCDSLIQEKPFDVHTITATKVSELIGQAFSRQSAKSVKYACLPMDTMILTKNGWKLFTEVVEGDTVLSMNTDTGLVEDDVIVDKHFFDDKEMFSYANKYDEIICTEDHRWYGWKRKWAKKGLLRPKEFGYFNMKESTIEHNIITAAPYVWNENSSVSVNDAKLIGWLCSDGYYAWSKKSTRTSSSNGKKKEVYSTISQAIHKYWKELEELLDEMGVLYGKHTKPMSNGNDVYQYKISSKWMRPFLDRVVPGRLDKHCVDWTQWLLSLSKEAADGFYETFYLGDGNMQSRERGEIVTQNAGNLCDAIATYMLLTGAKVSISNKHVKCRIIRAQAKSHIGCYKLRSKSLGIVQSFCITTKNSNFIIKQPTGYIGITGNCTYGAQAARVAKTVGCDLPTGQEIFDAFWLAAAPLAGLKEALTRWWETAGEKKFVLGLDGRKIMTRSQHALLNSLFQSAGVICAKRTMFIQDRLTKERGYSVDFWKEDWKNKQYIQQLIAYHDEAQSEITKGLVKWKKFNNEESAKEFQKENPLWAGPIHNEKGYFLGTSIADEILQEAIEQTNKYYKLKVPLAVEPQYGRNWRECH